MVTDFLGREIKVGDEIVYPTRYSSSLWMNHGRVEEIRPDDSWYGFCLGVRKLDHDIDDKISEGKLVTVRNLSNVVKL